MIEEGVDRFRLQQFDFRSLEFAQNCHPVIRLGARCYYELCVLEFASCIFHNAGNTFADVRIGCFVEAVQQQYG